MHAPTSAIRRTSSVDRAGVSDLRGTIAVPAVVTAVLWVTRLNDVGVLQTSLAFVMALVPWVHFQKWRRERTFIVPLVGIITLLYWLYFAVPLFWGDRIRPGTGLVSVLPDDSITSALELAVLAVLALVIGASLGLGRRLRFPRLPDLRPQAGALVYVRLIFLLGTLFSLSSTAGYAGGEQWRQVILTLQGSVPVVGYVMILRLVLQRKGTRLDVLLVVAYLVVSFVLGIASGWLGGWLSPALASIFTYLWVRGRLPLVAMGVGLAYVLFFQAGKGDFRSSYWGAGHTQAGVFDRVGAWIGFSATQWQNALTGGGTGGGKTTSVDLLRATVQRASLLTQTANVLDKTPSSVPYQYGSTYGYVFAGLVPRLFWPDKPSGNEANRFYQVAYSLTTPQNLGNVSIAVGTAPEAYINFAWPGVFFIMLLIGILLDFVQHSFLPADAGGFIAGIGILLMLHLIVIESQLGEYLSGMLQQGALTTVVFAPALRLLDFRQRRAAGITAS